MTKNEGGAEEAPPTIQEVLDSFFPDQFEVEEICIHGKTIKVKEENDRNTKRRKKK